VESSFIWMVVPRGVPRLAIDRAALHGRRRCCGTLLMGTVSGRLGRAPTFRREAGRCDVSLGRASDGPRDRMSMLDLWAFEPSRTDCSTHASQGENEFEKRAMPLSRKCRLGERLGASPHRISRAGRGDTGLATVHQRLCASPRWRQRRSDVSHVPPPQ
jgi:hypothetical protein